MNFWLKNRYAVVISLVLVAVLAGCTSMETFAPGHPRQLTSDEEERIGAAVESRLLQLLGGRYQDQALTAQVNRIGKACGVQVSVADNNSFKMYPLPGRRLVIALGPLMSVSSVSQLEMMIEKGASLSLTAMPDHNSWAMSKAVKGFLDDASSPHDPESADITMARLFADNPCGGECLGEFKSQGRTSSAVPVVSETLKAAEPGYQLLSEAKELEKSGDTGAAISLYLQAATVSPDQARILNTLGMAYLRAGDLQTARLHLDKANRLRPDYYKTLMGLGYVYLNSGKIEKARAALEGSVELFPVVENLFLLAEALEHSGEVASARPLYELVAADRNSKLGKTARQRLQEVKVQ